MATVAKRDAIDYSAVLESAAVHMNVSDLRAFILHQSATLATARTFRAHVVQSRRMAKRLMALTREQVGQARAGLCALLGFATHAPTAYSVLCSDAAATWATTYIPGAFGDFIATVLTALPNVA